LLFTFAKDHKPNVWWSDNGERLGTYDGHQGSVWQCDVNFSSTRLLTGSADQTCKLWDIQTGKALHSWSHKAGIRSVAFAHGERMFLAAQDYTFKSTPTIFVYNLSTDGEAQADAPVRSLSVTDGKSGKFSAALWGSLNQNIISASDDGYLRLWDVETGEQVQSELAHRKAINDMQFSKDQTMIITASSDFTAKLWDARTLELLKTFQSDRPVNSAAVSPTHPYVILGGGQEAMNVTTTSAKAGHFETDFYHIVYSEFLGAVKGHFGPINTLCFNPTGRQFVSGAEDGYVRLHNFDEQYLKNKAM